MADDLKDTALNRPMHRNDDTLTRTAAKKHETTSANAATEDHS